MDIKSIYNSISKEFSDSRYRVWSAVKNFLNSIPIHTLNADIGCGNGKNMKYRPELNFIGLDISDELILICRKSNLNVIQGNILSIPFNSNTYDNVISIAVIHHLKTIQERILAIDELIRITKVGGRILIYVWALEQPENSNRKFVTQDVLVPYKLKTGEVFDRFYHVYKYGEIENEIMQTVNNNCIEIEMVGYELGNHYVILRKIK
jgi:SAM-dependent methyltransferase